MDSNNQRASDTTEEDTTEWVVNPGTDVVDADGLHVGRVDDIRDGCLVVRKGRFFAGDYYIPFNAIASHDEATIYLNVVADDRATQIWQRQPGTTRSDETAGAESSAVETEERLDFLTGRDGNVRVPVIREELAATTRPVVRGAVRVETRVTEQEETLEVPVIEERVRIQRRRFDKDATASEITVDDGTFEIPFYGQDVDVEKHVRVIEEIIITREAVETVRRVSGTVRHEDVQFDESGVPQKNVDPRDLDLTSEAISAPDAPPAVRPETI